VPDAGRRGRVDQRAVALEVDRLCRVGVAARRRVRRRHDHVDAVAGGVDRRPILQITIHRPGARLDQRARRRRQPLRRQILGGRVAAHEDADRSSLRQEVSRHRAAEPSCRADDEHHGTTPIVNGQS
jgi:hypothetical protein